MRVVILHGSLGHPQENWFPWAKDVLEKRDGWRVSIPQLPTPENQNPKAWTDSFLQQIPEPLDVDVLIGHSCGGSFLLHLLQQSLVKPRLSVFVGSIIRSITPPQFKPLVEPFVENEFDWNIIVKNVGIPVIIHGDNDPYVPLQQALDTAQHLNVSPHIIPNGGHINAGAGYTTFPELLPLIDHA